MSENAEEMSAGNSVMEEPTDEVIATPSDLDYVLQALVSLANEGIEVGVTLTVGGFLVSGIVIGGKRFFEHATESLANLGQEHVREGMSTFFDSFGAGYDPLPEGETRPPAAFIHLKEARFFHNSGKAMPANMPVWWRGRISAVHGWMLGNMTFTVE